MFSLSQTTGYAILALSCLDDMRGRWVLSKEIAGATGIPQAYLSKILHALGRCGLIESKRGYRGGVAIARPAEEISLHDVATATEGEEYLPECMLGLADCTCCPTRTFWTKERARIEAQLRRVTLATTAQFIRDAGGSGPLLCRCSGAADSPKGKSQPGETGGATVDPHQIGQGSCDGESLEG